ncbi:tRNA threonylcarbamoyladenosine biosynthesis protein TsaB [bacterium HR21]|nr:tRNA threonylcarbamoyladenosine biosynthesis protein TsaB [bacterium HR21]
MAPVAVPTRLLALETSGDPLSIALGEDGQLRGFVLLGEPRVHDRMAAELIRRLLEDCRVHPEELDAVALSAGPGSFTGLRIGASLAKGLCFRSPPVLVPVPTLEAFAEAAAPFVSRLGGRQILVCTPGHIQESAQNVEGWLFVQRFSPDGTALGSVHRCSLSELAPEPDTFVCGPAAPWIPGGLRLPCLERLSAELILQAGYRRYQRGHRADPATFVPFYALDFQPGSSGSSRPLPPLTP